MSSSFKALAFLMFSNVASAQNADKFRQFCESNFEKWQGSFSSQVFFSKHAKTNVTSSNIFGFDKESLIANYVKARRELPKSIYLSGKAFPIYYHPLDSIVILVYDYAGHDDYGEVQLKTFFHLFSNEWCIARLNNCC